MGDPGLPGPQGLRGGTGDRVSGCLSWGVPPPPTLQFAFPGTHRVDRPLLAACSQVLRAPRGLVEPRGGPAASSVRL